MIKWPLFETDTDKISINLSKTYIRHVQEQTGGFYYPIYGRGGQRGVWPKTGGERSSSNLRRGIPQALLDLSRHL